jgi:type II secretion system protein J
MIARSASQPRGFSLLELILVMGMIAMITLSMYNAMQITNKAKKGAIASVEPARTASIAADLIQSDLENILPLKAPPAMANEFVGTHQAGVGGGDADTVEFYTLGKDENAQDQPLSDGVRQIQLVLRTDTNPPTLVREITRDLISQQQQQPEEQILCSGVRSFSLRYYDGTEWQDTWDSTTVNDALPLAVSFTLDIDLPGQDPTDPNPRTQRITMIIPLAVAKPLDTGDASDTGGTP